MRYAFDDPDAAERRTTQYFEMFGNRGIYHEGWTAVTRHSTPWLIGRRLPPFEDDVWELYDTTTDWSQAHDLAAEMPDKLAELKQLWHDEAVKYNVLPLDDRRIERFDPDLAGRPELVQGNSQLLFGGMDRLTENSVLNIKNKSHAVTAQLDGARRRRRGRRHRPGRRLRRLEPLRQARPAEVRLQPARRPLFTIEGDAAIPSGTHQLRMEFAYDGGGLAKGGDRDALHRRRKVGDGRVDATVPMVFSGDETADIGSDTASPVTPDYSPEQPVHRQLKWVQIDVDAAAEDADHMISPEQRLQVAMARQ